MYVLSQVTAKNLYKKNLWLYSGTSVKIIFMILRQKITTVPYLPGVCIEVLYTHLNVESAIFQTERVWLRNQVYIGIQAVKIFESVYQNLFQIPY